MRAENARGKGFEVKLIRKLADSKNIRSYRKYLFETNVQIFSGERAETHPVTLVSKLFV